MESKEKEVKPVKEEENRFTYSSDNGLKVLTEEDILNEISNLKGKSEENSK